MCGLSTYTVMSFTAGLPAVGFMNFRGLWKIHHEHFWKSMIFIAKFPIEQLHFLGISGFRNSIFLVNFQFLFRGGSEFPGAKITRTAINKSLGQLMVR